jgi:hypothetical protein
VSTTLAPPVAATPRDLPNVLETLSEEECYLWALLSDPSGLDQAEFLWYDPDADDGCFRAWPFQWGWYRTTEPLQIDQCARSVGKTLSIKVRGCAFPLLYPGQEMVITAPELVHLEPITTLIEQQIYSTRLLNEMLPRGRSAVTHRPFQMNFQNGSRIIGRIPQRDGKGVKGIHPIWLELDEAQDYPHAGWVELIETLKRGHEGAVWRAHGVTRGVRDDFYNYTQDTPDNHWKVHRFAAMQRPTWTDEERQEKIQKYKGREDPNYRRNVLGLHGDATSPIFVLHRLMACADSDETSDYNVDEYFFTTIKSEMLKYAGDSIASVLDFPMRHRSYLGPPSGKPRASFWVGMDIGFTVDPTEILVFVEYRPKRDAPSKLKLITRIQLVRMDHHNQVHAMLHTIDFYKPKVFAMDKGGLGLPLVQEMQEFGEHPELIPAWAQGYDIGTSLTRIKGYNFSSNLLVEFDQSIEVEPWEDAEKKAGIFRNAKEQGSDVLRDLVDAKRMELPWDAELLRQWQGGTWMPSKGHDQYGRRRYSEGDDHTLDAARMMALGWSQFSIEEFKREREPGPVFDSFISL